MGGHSFILVIPFNFNHAAPYFPDISLFGVCCLFAANRLKGHIRDIARRKWTTKFGDGCNSGWFPRQQKAGGTAPKTRLVEIQVDRSVEMGCSSPGRGMRFLLSRV